MVAGSTKGLRNQFVSGRATHNQAIRICIVDMYHGFFFVHWLLLCFLHHLDMCNVSFWHRLPTCFLPHIRSSLTSFLPPSLIPSFVPFLHLLSFFLPSFLPLYRILLLSRKASFFLPSLPSVLPSFLHSILLCLLLCLPPSFYIYIYKFVCLIWRWVRTAPCCAPAMSAGDEHPAATHGDPRLCNIFPKANSWRMTSSGHHGQF